MIFNHQDLITVPWSSWQDWIEVKTQLFSSDSDTITEGIERVSLWHNRGSCPGAVEATSHLLICILSPHKSPVPSDFELIALYSHAILRLTTCVLDQAQTNKARSLSSLASDLRFPLHIVDLRQSIVHAGSPSLAALAQGIKDGLNWIKEYYWDAQFNQIINDFNLFNSEFSKFAGFVVSLRKDFAPFSTCQSKLIEIIKQLLSQTFAPDFLISDLIISFYNFNYNLLLPSTFFNNFCLRFWFCPALIVTINTINQQIPNFLQLLFLRGIEVFINLVQNFQQPLAKNLIQILNFLMDFDFFSSPRAVIPCSCHQCPDPTSKQFSKLRSEIHKGRSISQKTIDQSIVLIFNSNILTENLVINLLNVLGPVASSKYSDKYLKISQLFDGVEIDLSEMSDFKSFARFNQNNWSKYSLFEPCPFGTVPNSHFQPFFPPFSDNQIVVDEDQKSQDQMIEQSTSESDFSEGEEVEIQKVSYNNITIKPISFSL
ncbi:hypothetical protein RCL1_000287 [Eukaryota sp. TZLM3-RCL]